MTPAAAKSAWLALVVLALFAVLRPHRARVREDLALAFRFPSQLDGERAQLAAKSASEALLDQRRGVALSKVRYGRSLVTSIVVSSGVREHHPLSVCLRASGLAIGAQRTITSGASCINELRVRKGSREATVVAAYLDRSGRSECHLARRILWGGWQRLLGRSARWTQLQVLDPDPVRATRRLRSLINAELRRNHHEPR